MKKQSIVRIKLANVKIHEFTCPLSNVIFIGNCPNISCPANISERNNNNSGCYYEDTKISNIVTVAKSLHITTHEVKRRYRKGMLKLDKFTQFYHWLTNHRELNQNIKYCPNCGITNDHGLVCLNGKRCLSRQKLYNKIKQRFPFNITTLLIKPNEIWSCHKTKLQELIFKRKLNEKIKALLS